MSIPPIGERTHGSMAILAIGCLLLACCLAGCSGQPQASSSETGSFTCSLAWPEEVPTLEEGAARVAGGIDCAAEGIDTVAFAFYDATGSYLTGDEWPCFLGEGTVDGIPAGSNRRLVVTGEDASGTVIYRGEKTGITIIANQVTQGGEIDMLPVSLPAPTNLTATPADEQVTLSWYAVEGATSYTIYWSKSFSGVSPTNYEGKIPDIAVTTYTHTDLDNGWTYCYVITAVNDFGESEESQEVCATPDWCLQVPGVPDNVTATPGDGQITIGWDSVDCATSYNLYWATYAGVSKTYYEGKITDIATTTYTHTDRDNGTTYYYVVTAENDFGESDESEKVSATPQGGYTNSIEMSFALISAGTFTMGSPLNELGRDDDETQHEVTLTKSFYLQTTEVTQGQWRAVMGYNPSSFSDCGDNCPVEEVSWRDVQQFITKLNEREATDTYRLPTEAEWEYACRAGSTTAFANGDITETGCGYDPNLDAMGWYCYNSSETHPVAQKAPNAWGLYDMHGNVWEWCMDWYGDYPTDPVTDPIGPTSGTDRVMRGGSWTSDARNCRSAYRNAGYPDDYYDDYGFRVVKDL
jgi:formylglycine-generating enzyme required for sulfatase activity